jgi:hypothetical protein
VKRTLTIIFAIIVASTGQAADNSNVTNSNGVVHFSAPYDSGYSTSNIRFVDTVSEPRFVTTIVTNTIPVRQYRDTSFNCSVYGCTQDHSVWIDESPITNILGNKESRPHPNKKILEVRKIIKLTFIYESKKFEVVLKDELVDKPITMVREVSTNETWRVEK